MPTTSTAATTTRVSPELFTFLRQLKRNNRRPWFLKNKPRYEALAKEPMLQLIRDLQAPLGRISPYLRVEPKAQGGSLFRIYRDVRFSKDKSPYKTHVSAHFSHRASRDGVHSPGFYLHLEPGECFLAGGMWHPESQALRMIRDYMRSHPEKWLKVTAELKVEGERLKRLPLGVSADDPLAEDLKLKSFMALVNFTQAQVCAPGFAKRIAKGCEELMPLMRFLAEATRLPL